MSNTVSNASWRPLSGRPPPLAFNIGCCCPPCLVPVEIKISFLSLGKVSCQTPHQTLDQNHVPHHSYKVGDMNLASPKLVGRSPAPLPCFYFLICLFPSAPRCDALWPSGLQPLQPYPSVVAPSKLPGRFMETCSDPSATGYPSTISQGYCLKSENAVTPWNHSTSSGCLGFNYSYFQPNASQISG